MKQEGKLDHEFFGGYDVPNSTQKCPTFLLLLYPVLYPLLNCSLNVKKIWVHAVRGSFGYAQNVTHVGFHLVILNRYEEMEKQNTC